MGGHQWLILLVGLPVVLGTRLPYIIGGQEVSEQGRYPWQGSLQDYEHLCGASLISKRWALTAAHCVIISSKTFHVVFGTNDLKDTQARRYKVKNIYTPAPFNYRDPGYPNDIALLEFEEDVDTSGPYVKTIRLASEGQSFAGNRNCWVSGWGTTKYGGKTPNLLRELHVDVYTKQYCANMHGEEKIGDYHICVGKHGKSGICHGDSGGPLACKVGGQWVLAGATSWAKVCDINYPSVYASVPYYRAWIKEVSGV